MTLQWERYIILHRSHCVYPAGKPIMLHLLRCQELGIAYYSLIVSGAFSTFAQLGFNEG